MTDREAILGEIHARIEAIPEPCSIAMRSPLSIGEMGLVDEVTIDDAGRVSVALCLTDPGCVHYRGMVSFITDAVLPIEGVKTVEVRQVLDKLWTDDRMRRRSQ